jgi:hypothetical protein
MRTVKLKVNEPVRIVLLDGSVITIQASAQNSLSLRAENRYLTSGTLRGSCEQSYARGHICEITVGATN